MLKCIQNLIPNSHKLIHQMFAAPSATNSINQLSKFTTSTPLLVASRPNNQAFDNKKDKKTSKNEDELENDDLFGYNKSNAYKAKILQDFGIIKSYAKWPQYNRVIYPPSEDGKPTKNPYVHHMRNMIKYPAEKLWFPAFMIRGMSIDEAIKQLSFHKMKGAGIIKEVLLEAQELAVKQHNIEFKSNLWISYSSSSRAMIIKGIRKHKGPRVGVVKYRYSNYYVRLEEGQPPPKYHLEAETYEARAKAYIEKLRQRSIHLSL